MARPFPIPQPAPTAGRGAAGGLTLPPLESALVAVTSLHVCALPWALGDMHAWSQCASLGASLAGFILALLPRAAPAGPAEPPTASLLRFPVFWCGLVLLAYVAVQGLNPAWRFETDSRSWWLVPIGHVPWLPAGVEGPFARSNPWRELVVFGSLWLLLCSLWCGFRRRRSYRILFGALVAGGFLLALLGFAERLTETRRIFWTYLPSNGSFAASFIYRNHAGAYFNLVAALSTGMALWHLRRARRRLEGQGASVFYGFAAVWAGVMVLITYSRTSVVLLLVFTVLLAAALALRLPGQKGPLRRRAEFAALAVALASILGIVLVSLNSEKLWHRFAELAADPSSSARDRALVRRAAGDLRRDRPLLGWGAGCFRYVFPPYARRYPEIYYSESGNLRYWEHAHDDLLEFPAELGLAGMAPVAVALAWGAARLVRLRFWRHAVALPAALGCLMLPVHAWVDFVLQNPAVLVTWAVILAGTLRWMELETPASGLSSHRGSIRGRPSSSPA